MKDTLVYARQYLGPGAFAALLMASVLDLALVSAARGVKWLRGRARWKARVPDPTA